MNDKNDSTNAQSFYRAFEDRHRGSRELIRKRLEQYLPFIKPLNTIYPDGLAIDLGCGRGEWLEVATEAGFRARGVDIDVGMLDACVERGLDTVCTEAIDYLSEQSDSTVCIVSAFHVIEHIPFEELKTLVSEAARVLLPGGLLILETPNPENLVMGTVNFYLDPSHIRPIPTLLLEFLAEYFGFVRWKIVRLQESLELSSKNDPQLWDVLNGASPDYSLIAQKSAQKKILRRFDTAFAKDYGLTPDLLSRSYDDYNRQRFEMLQADNLRLHNELSELKMIVESLRQSEES